MLAAGCSERGTTTGADHVAFPAVVVALAGSNTAAVTAAIANTVTPSITTTIPTAVASPVAATGSSTGSATTASPTSAATVPEHRSCCRGGNHQSEHEHTESCHVAPPPERKLDYSGSGIHLLTSTPTA